MFRRKKLKESKRQKEEEEGNSTVVNHNVNHLDVDEKRRDVFLQASSSKPWDRESITLDTRLENHSGQFRFRADEDSSHFRCPDCSIKGQRGMGPNVMRWNNRINREMEADKERERWRMRMVTKEQKRKPGTQRGILSRDIPNKVNFSSQPKRETFNERPENLPAYETGRDMDSYRIHVEGKGPGYETLQCESCHRTYRQQEQTIRPGRFESNIRDSAAFNGFLPQHRLNDKAKNQSHFDMVKNTDLRRERNVTFDLESLGTLEPGNIQGKDKRGEEVRTSRDKEKEREKRAKIQSGRLLKVKLNLNPLRKSKVHPKRKNEQDHLEKDSSKKCNEKRQQHGKDRQEKGGKGKCGNKTKARGEKLKKSTKSRRPSDDSVKEKEEEGKGEESGIKTNSESEQTVQGENKCPDNSQTGDITSGAGQSIPAVATEQEQNSQGGSVQYQEAGLVLGSAELSSKLPFSLSAAERNHTNFPLLASAGSQLSGSSLSLQGGNFLLNTMASGFGPANSLGPSIAVSGPNLASSGALDSFSWQTGVGLTSPATALLTNTVHANPLQSCAIQTAPLPNSQAGGLALNLAANPAIIPEPTQSLFQSQLHLPDRLKSELTQGPGLQTGQGFHQLLPESQAPQIKESLPVQAQAPTDGLTVVTSQKLGSVMTLENLSNTQTETGREAGGSTSAGGAPLAAGPAAGVPGDSMQATDVSVSGVGGSSTGDAADAAVLLHQEYLSEEGDSSPRRKLRLALPEKTSSRPPTALERKIR